MAKNSSFGRYPIATDFRKETKNYVTIAQNTYLSLYLKITLNDSYV
jgi:hypothetical protein